MVLASVLLPALSEVLIAMAISSFFIISSIFGRPSEILSTLVDGTPASFNAACVPEVATISNPKSVNMVANAPAFGLSVPVRERNTFPSSGILFFDANCDFAKDMPKFSEIPITSPVDFISGPKIRSDPGSLLNGNTASLTATWFLRVGSIIFLSKFTTLNVS